MGVSIELNEYTKVIKGITILDSINLKLESGKCYGLKGKNGSGKTMVMRAICGLINATKGCVNINGEILGKDISFPRSVGALIENPAFISNYTGFKNLKVLASIKEKATDEQIKEIMETVGLSAEDKRIYKKYSLGMKQKLGIASAFMEEPDIIILDEPINAIDEKSVEKVKDMIVKAKLRDALVIIACHDTEELNLLSDEIIQIEEGRIIND